MRRLNPPEAITSAVFCGLERAGLFGEVSRSLMAASTAGVSWPSIAESAASIFDDVMALNGVAVCIVAKETQERSRQLLDGYLVVVRTVASRRVLRGFTRGGEHHGIRVSDHQVDVATAPVVMPHQKGTMRRVSTTRRSTGPNDHRQAVDEFDPVSWSPIVVAAGLEDVPLFPRRHGDPNSAVAAPESIADLDDDARLRYLSFLTYNRRMMSVVENFGMTVTMFTMVLVALFMLFAARLFGVWAVLAAPVMVVGLVAVDGRRRWSRRWGLAIEGVLDVAVPDRETRERLETSQDFGVWSPP